MGRLTALVPLGAKHAVRRALHRPSSSARRYLPRDVSVDGFLRTLTDQHVRYAVLRWFEALPFVGPGEDIDVLVADADLAAVEAILTPYRPHPTAQKVDLYSSGGAPRTTFGGAPYFPAPLAARVLDRAVLLHGAYRVPSPEDHFASLAYHAVYHKGVGALSSEDRGDEAEGRIVATLRRLASEHALEIELSIEGLRDHLADQGFQPSPGDAVLLSAERRRLYPG